MSTSTTIVQRSRLLRIAEVCSIIGVSRATIYKWAAGGKFPRPIPLSRKCSVFDEGEIDAWVEQQRQARDARH